MPLTGMRTVEEQLARVLSLSPRVTGLSDDASPRNPNRAAALRPPRLLRLSKHDADAHGALLAQDVEARVHVPPFDNSAMDGFAVRSRDLTPGCRLDVVGDIPAGAMSAPPVGPGQAARIMTGAPMPQGADCVVPVEHTDQPMGAADLPGVVVVNTPVATGQHVRRQGENTRTGEVVLPAGMRWSPAAASAAASLGHGEVRLWPRPRVAVLSTGTELVPPGQPLGFGQIPDSNSILLAGLVRQFGADLHSAGCVPDDNDAFRTALDDALEADLIVTTGGVSVGAFEVVRQVTEDRVEFAKVAMQPGKPQASGRLQAPDGRPVPMLGLPGNPVSAFVSAWVFLRPLIAQMGGWDTGWPSADAVAAEAWRTPPNRRQYIPVEFTGDGVRPVHAQGSGSHLVATLALADGLAVVPAEVDRVRAGDQVHFHRTTF